MVKKMIDVKNMISDELEGIHELDFTPDTAGAGRNDAPSGPAEMGASD